MLKFTTLKAAASAAVIVLAASLALPAVAQDASDAPAAEETAPAPDAGAAEAPAEPAAPTEEPAASPESAGTDSGAAPETAAPAESADAPAPAAAAPSAADLALNAPVVASDGKEIGTVARISKTADGGVAEIYVNTGSASVIVPGSAIAEAGSTVKLSISAEDAAKLPAAGGASE